MKKIQISSKISGYQVFLPVYIIEKSIWDPISRFHEAKKNDPIMAAAKLFGDNVNISPFED